MQHDEDEQHSAEPFDLKRVADLRDVAAALGHVHGMREIEPREREDLRDAQARMHIPPPRFA